MIYGGGGARSIDCFIPFVWRGGDSTQPYQKDLLAAAASVTVPDGWIVTRLNLSRVSLKCQQTASVGPQPGFWSRGLFIDQTIKPMPSGVRREPWADS